MTYLQGGACRLVCMLLFFGVLLTGCTSNDSAPPDIVLNGHVDVSAIDAGDRQGPIFVLAAKSTDMDKFEDDPESVAFDVKPLDADNGYSMSLTPMGALPGDTVSLIGFIDNNFDNEPALDAGDFVGFYMPPDSFATVYTLTGGNTENLDIKITRRVFDFDAEIGGTVYCDDADLDCSGGHDLTILAYAAPVNSSDFSALDPDGVIGVRTYEDVSFPFDYLLSILPFGYDVPIENVHLMAFLDTNDNGTVDAGDILGSYALSADDLPACLTIFDGMQPETDRFPIYMMQTNNASAAGSDITVSGSITMPPGGKNTADMPVVVAVSDPDTMNDGGSGMASFDYFQILPPGEYDFTLDLSGTRFEPGDEIMVAALWDRNFDGCFPDQTPGDWMGFYADASNLQSAIVLAEGNNSGVDIDISREVFDFEAEIGGTVYCDAADLDCSGGHDLTIVAYAGPITSSDFSGVDSDGVIGFKTYEDVSFPLDYTLSILPYGYDVPVENVHLMTFLDINDNGMIDAGDIVGSYAYSADDMPRCVTIVDGMTPRSTDFSIYFTSEAAGAGGSDITVSGSITLPVGGENTADMPVVVAVADPATIESGDSTMSSVDYFKMLPPGDLDYDLDLSGTRFEPGDEVMIFALWDRDYGGCFPDMTPGDVVGFYSVGIQSFTVVLEDGDNTGVDIDVNRDVYDFEAEIGGTVVCDGGAVTCENGHDLIIVAYAEPINSMDFAELDPKGVIAYKRYANVSFPLNYTLPILPYGYDVPIKDVHLMAFLDVDDDGTFGPGDIVGYYTDDDGMPAAITITEGMTAATTDVEISLSMTINQASGYDISISGSIERPSGYDENSPPIFIFIMDEVENLSVPDMSTFHYFQRLDAEAVDFDIDLSGTSLIPGDRVTVLALYDQDFNGFPILTPVVDLLGIYMNLNVFQFGIPLSIGTNTVNPGLADWSFEVTRRYYDHKASVYFQVDCGDYCSAGDDLILVAISKEGVNNGSGFDAAGIYYSSLSGQLDLDIDLDYVVGYDTTVQVDNDYWYSMNFLPIIRDQDSVHPNPSDPFYPGGYFFMESVYLFAIRDVIGDGNLEGDPLGAYWQWFVPGLVRTPADFTVIDKKNVLDDNQVLFWGETYP